MEVNDCRNYFVIDLHECGNGGISEAVKDLSWDVSWDRRSQKNLSSKNNHGRINK